jgi:hypothetical protein
VDNILLVIKEMWHKQVESVRACSPASGLGLVARAFEPLAFIKDG